jgi:hypothetical protein
LPSKDELNKLYLSRAAIGGFENTGYWSSSEVAQKVAWWQNFSNGAQSYDWGYGAEKTVAHNVRAIRAF